MKNCPNCQRPVADSDRFCQHCGATVPAPKKRKAWLWIVLAVVLLGAVAAGIWLATNVITENRWQEQYDLGMRCLDDGDYEEAALAFLAAIEIDPARPDAYLAAAEAYVKQGDYDEAISILKKGVRATGDEDLEEELEELEEEAEAAEAAEDIALTIGGNVLSGAELNYYFVDAVNNFYNSYSAYVPMLGLDPYTPLDQQVYDANAGMTWADYFLEDAINSAVFDYVLCDAAKAEGYALDPEDRSELEAQLETAEFYAEIYGYDRMDGYLRALYGSAATEESYGEYLERGFLAEAYYTYREEQLTITAEDVQVELQKNGDIYGQFSDSQMVNARHILILPQGGTYDEATGMTSYSEEAWYAAETEAEALLAEWLYSGGTEEAFAEYANAYSYDGDGTTGGLYTYIYPGQMIDPFNDWCFDSSRRVGDSGIIRTDYGYHIMYFSGYCDETYREYLAADNLRRETMEHWVEELVAAAEVTRGSTRGISVDLILMAE